MEASKVSIKITPFWVDRPEMWFYQVEAQFAISKVTCEQTMFNYLVAQLEPRFMESIWDIIKDTSINKYTAAKERLLNTFKESDNNRIKRLLTGLELGDMKPSQLLLKMKSLGVDMTDTMLRSLWLEKMPDSVKQILVVSEETLDKLAIMADKIVELNSRQELSSVSENTVVEELRNKIAALELQISTITARHSRSRTHDFSGQRSKSRSKSRRRFDKKGKYCYYHFTFGEKCYPQKCQPPCQWNGSGNSNQQQTPRPALLQTTMVAANSAYL